MKKNERNTKGFLANFSKKNFFLMLNWTFLLTFLICFRVSADSYSQNKRINLDIQEITLKKAFSILEKKGNIRILYSEDNLPEGKNFTLLVNDTPVIEAIQMLLENTDLTYRVLENGLIVIAPRYIETKDIVVRGQVTGANGESLPGVGVRVKGTTLATSTDAQGKYSISIPGNNAILVFTYIGYLAKEVAVNNQNLINVTLEASTTELSEVVVTALGIMRETKSLTFSTQNINTKELTEARELNVVNSLQGKVTGLSINSAGTGLGAPDRVVLRGDRSISGDSQPLYVIDGVPVSGNPGDINPDNISSINVLKGPSAAALYGSAAQNGVIIIETKKGNAGVTKVSFSNNTQVLNPDIPVAFQNDYAQGIAGVYQPKSESSWGPKMTGQMVPTWSINPADAGKQIALSPQPNNVSDFYQNGFSTANNLIISMGSEKIQGNFSFTRTDANGTVPQNNLKRNDIAVRMTAQPSDKLSLDMKIQGMQQNISDPIVEDINNFNQTKQIYMIPRSISTADAMNYSFADAAGVIRQNFWDPGSTLGLNPYFLLNRQNSNDVRQRAMLMSSVSYKFSNALKFMVRGAYDAINTNSESKISYDFYSRAPLGSYTVSSGKSFLLNGDFLLTYNKKINKDINFDINFGGSDRKAGGNSVSSNTNKGLIVPDFWSITNTLLPTTSYSPGSNSIVQSLYGFSHFAWKNAVFLDITGRNDWSSTLPAANRSYFYPSIGLSAVLSDLVKFLQKVWELTAISFGVPSALTTVSPGKIFLPKMSPPSLPGRVASDIPS